MWNGNKPGKMKKYVLKNKVQQRQCNFADLAIQKIYDMFSFSCRR